MGIYVDVITDRSLGTATGKTQLSGDRSGNATDYVLPASARGVLFVEPYVYVGTPAANDAMVATLKIETSDIKSFQTYEVFMPPVGGIVASITSGIDSILRTIYPVFWPVAGGERFQFYGVLQSATTGTLFAGADIWWTDDASELTDLPFFAKVGGTPGASGSLTSTGTATGSVTGATITLTGGPKVIRAAPGVVCPTTPVTSAIAGWFSYSAAELAYIIREAIEPIPSSISATQFPQQPAHLTKKDNIKAPVTPPSTIATGLVLTKAPGTAGIFGNSILYNSP